MTVTISRQRMTARITKPAQDALGRASLLEQVRLSREAELSRLRAISGPQPHRHAPHAEVEMSGVMSSADWAAWNEATIDVFLAGIRARHAITSDSDAQPHPSAD